MRRIALALCLITVVSLIGLQPASATHNCTQVSCNPVTVALLEGRGKVCATSGLGNCTFHNDALWTGSTAVAQGLYCPTRGPGAGSISGGDPTGAPFSFNAGPGVGPPNSVCVSNVGGTGCAFESSGQLGPGDPSGLGAYAFSSQGKGVSTFTAPPVSGVHPAVSTTATFGWEQSAATILPLRGEVTSTQGKGATVVGFTSSRSFQDGGNCGISTGPTTIFQVEGMIVTF